MESKTLEYSLLVCLIVILVDACWCSCGLKTTSLGKLKELSNDQSFQIVSSNETIIALGLKRSMNISSVKSLFENKRIILFTPNADIYSISAQRLEILESSFKTLLEIYNISSSGLKVTSLISAYRINSDCAFGSVLIDFWSAEESPIIITTDREMPKLVRLMRENNKLGRYMQMEDLHVIKLAPLLFSYTNLLDQSSISCVTNLFNNFTLECEEAIGLCKEEVEVSNRTNCYLQHDYCLLRSSKMSFSNSSFEFDNFVKYLERKYPQIKIYTNETIDMGGYSPNNNISYMRSEVYECSYSSCAFEPVKYEEIQGVYVIFFIAIYYIGLIFTYNTKSMRIRLAVPYLCPFFVLVRVLLQAPYFALNCTRLYNGMANLVVLYPVIQYAITLLRYFYLRNLFAIISKSDNFKLYKFLASKWFGLVLSLSVPTIFALISFLLVVDKEIYLTSTLIFFRNGPLGGVLILGIVACLILLALDMIGNRRKIKKKGLYYYFFFDDPFYIKIDLVFISFLLILTIISFIVYSSVFATYALLVVFSLACITVLGGSVMVIEIYKKITRLMPKKNNENPTNDLELESRLHDVNLMKLLRKFAEKEFSIENIMLYESLKSLETKKKLVVGESTDVISTANSTGSNTSDSSYQYLMSLNQAAQIEELYIRNYAKYEVNFPNLTKKLFYKWFEEKKSEFGENPSANSISYSELKDILMIEVLKNVYDTFSRMIETVEYKKWLKLTELQKENELYDF